MHMLPYNSTKTSIFLHEHIYMYICIPKLLLFTVQDINCICRSIRLIFKPQQFTSGRVDFWMLDRSSKMINSGGRVLVLHSQRMKMVSYVQPVIREPEDSWHRSAFDSWIHIIKLYRCPRTLCGITLNIG